MRLFRLERVQLLPIGLDQAWDFFSDPANLGRITPDWLCFDVRCTLPERMFAGQVIEYRIRLNPVVTVRWITEITHVEEGVRFVDEQRFGPYRFWHHLHTFEAVPEGVRMTDSVHYGLGFSFLGDALERFYVRPKLEAIFDHRGKTLRELFGCV